MKDKTSFKTKVARKISEFSQDEWNKVFPPVLESYNFFKSLDESNFAQFSFFYIMLYDGSVPVAATSCFTMEFPLDITVQGPFKRVLDCIKMILPDILSPKTLICGLPMGQGRIGISKDPDGVIRAVYNCMETIAAQEGVSMFIFKDFTSAYDDILGPLLGKGFFKIESLPSTDMDIRFNSFDQYLKTLSPVSREGVKRKFKKIDGKVKIDLEITDAIGASVAPEVYGLYLQAFEKHDVGLEKLTPEFFRHISKNMTGEIKYFLWRIEGKLAAFALCLVSQELFIDYYLGFDYSLAYQYNLYLIRFRDLMNWCIARGIKKYEMGVTGYEGKRRLGFYFIRLYFYMRHRNNLVNVFFKIFNRFFRPENFDPVFKEMKRIRQK